ncbi:hypothetical protein [Nocardioides pocheonensis]|uniref:Uncharacterized protein n=1 Tax=Nocardioides pocheonensis TaxID=661485 RepID=A0A3N0GNS1_9ACTN|nr:hypothetical protein [Nocardioides pocheonensis]RNM13798.1 hypothetical protein EFL26_12570 [Nocardioides pocheonensis]
MSTPDPDVKGHEPVKGRPGAAVRVLVVLLVCVAGVVGWRAVAEGLAPPVEIVGYPSFAGFDFHRQFLVYRLVVWVLPLCLVLVVALLRRRFSSPSDTSGDHLDPWPTGPVGSAAPVGAREGRVTTAAQVVLSSALVALAVSTVSASPGGHVDLGGSLAAVAYAGSVVALGALVARRAAQDLPAAVATVNGLVSGLLAPVAVWLFAHGSAVEVDRAGRDHWRWLPWWCPLVVVGLLCLHLARTHRRGGSLARLGSRAATTLVVPAVLFLLVARMPGQVVRIEGFDDMQGVTGADLLGHGFFPWRDFIFIHGVFEDALRSVVGFHLFEHSLWGSQAASGVVWIPLGWIGLYALGAWSARGRAFAAVPALVLAVTAAQHLAFPDRWLGAAYVFVILGQAIRTRSPAWTVALTFGLFVEAVLVPEAVYQVVACAVALLAADVVQRTPGDSVVSGLRRTVTFGVTGAALSAVWLLYLATQHAASDFVGYYRLFGPGHAESGTLPVGPYVSTAWYLTFCATTALVVVTFAVLGRALLERRPTDEITWLLLATALFAGLYGEKAVGRFDDPHVQQSVTAALPLVFVWLAVGFGRLESRWRSGTLAGPRLTSSLPLPTLATAFLLVAVPVTASAAWDAPGRAVATASGLRTPGIGYHAAQAMAPDTLSDLGAVVRSLGGDGPVFDFSNSPGIVHFLLHTAPATRYFHVSMAIAPDAQRDLVRRLEVARPRVVVFDSDLFGLATWDGVSNQVRHYLVSDFVLSGWTPVVRSHGMLFLLRNDLVRSRPALPALAEPPETTDLDRSTCDWGLAAAYLPSAGSGTPVTLGVGRPSSVRRLVVSGWAYDPTTDAGVRTIVVRVGGTTVATLAAHEPRPRLAATIGIAGAAQAGFDADVVIPAAGDVQVVAIGASGSTPLAVADGEDDAPATRRPGSAPLGRLDSLQTSTGTLSPVEVPAGLRLSDYHLATLSSGGHAMGASTLTLVDGGPAGSAGHVIRARTLPDLRALRVRVGSCLAWRGVEADRLNLLQEGGSPVDRIVLSGVS